MPWRHSGHAPLPCCDLHEEDELREAGSHPPKWLFFLSARAIFSPWATRYMQGARLRPASAQSSDEEDFSEVLVLSARQLQRAHAVPTTSALPVVLGASALVLAIVAWGGGRPAGRHLHVTNGGSLYTVLVDCGATRENLDYEGDLQHLFNSEERSAGDCRIKCESTPQCSVWSWGRARNVKGLTDVCTLKHAQPSAQLTRFRRYGVVAGMRSGPECPPANEHAKSLSAQGLIKNRHGLCLDAPQPGIDGSLVHMWTCRGNPNQLWEYDEGTGQIKNSGGFCLGATHWAKDFADVGMHQCDTGNWSQQWSYDPVTGIIKTWRGICLSAGERYRDGGATYIRTCDTKSSNHQWRIGTAADMEQDGPAPIRGGETTMYCFALMRPHSYEQDLLATQFKNGASIFACDKYDVFSNEVLEVYPGLNSRLVDSSLECSQGGEFGTALNLDIFIEVWKQVIVRGAYKEVAWTVKVDPDAVFLVQRLRMYLPDHSEEPLTNGVYLNNCKYGLHGPIEVFSRRAVELWARGWNKCKQHFQEKCQGDCFWGEDIFVDQCLSTVLKVRRDNDFRLLVEDHCDPPQGWESCKDQSYVVFHPFKTALAYMDCLTKAGEVLTPRPPAPPADPSPQREVPVDASPPPVVPPVADVPSPPAPVADAQPVADVLPALPPVADVQPVAVPVTTEPPSSAEPLVEILPITPPTIPATTAPTAPPTTPAVPAPETPPALAAMPAPETPAPVAPTSIPTILPLPKRPETTARPEEACHTAEKGEGCYTALIWARDFGIAMHPSWYPGLTQTSSMWDFQAALSGRSEVKCPPPCR